MAPIARRRYEIVFHRIEIAVGNVIAQVTLVANIMLPIPPLPDAAFAFLFADGTQAFRLRE